MAISDSAVQVSPEVNKFVASSHKLLIDGQWVDAASGKTFPVYNPATGEVLANVAEGDKEDINRAVAAATANNTNYGLAAGVWTHDISKAHRLAKLLRAGTVWVNCYSVFDAALPFGGYKQSGWGREMGHDALNNYLETKAVTIAL